MLNSKQEHSCSIPPDAHLCDTAGMQHWTLDYLTAVLERMDWSANRLATETGLAASTINRPLREKDWKFGLSAKTVARIHAATGVDPKPFMPDGMEEPAEMYRASSDSLAARVLRDMDKPDDEKPNAQARNEIKIAVVGDLAQIVATVDKAGLAKLRAKLEAIEAVIDD